MGRPECLRGRPHGLFNLLLVKLLLRRVRGVAVASHFGTWVSEYVLDVLLKIRRTLGGVQVVLIVMMVRTLVSAWYEGLLGTATTVGDRMEMRAIFNVLLLKGLVLLY